jgi:phosphate starvation-inducible PhoH-like protein
MNAALTAADQNDVAIRTRRKLVTPRTAMQKAYVTAIRGHELVFGTGPPAPARPISRLPVRLRPGERRGRSHHPVSACRGSRRTAGFLPGDMKEKIDPYLRPLYDAFTT